MAEFFRGDVYWTKSNSEQLRPVLIVSRTEMNRGSGVVVVPFYSQQIEKRRALESCVFFQAGDGGLKKDCVAKCDEIGIRDISRLDTRRG